MKGLIIKKSWVPFLWHGFFLALTMSMIDLNTVLPSLLSQFTKDTRVFGLFTSLILGAPLLFNYLFGRFQQKYPYRKPFLLIGIFIRGLAFILMALVISSSARMSPETTLLLLGFLVFLFSISGGFAGIAYSDVIGKLIPAPDRGALYSTRQLFIGLGGVFGGTLLMGIFKNHGMHLTDRFTVGLIIGAVGLIVGAVGFMMIKETSASTVFKGKAEEGKVLSDLRVILFGDVRFTRFLVMENLSAFGLMMLPFYMILISRDPRWQKDFLGYFIVVQVIGSFVSNWIWAMISRRFGAQTAVRTCLVVGILIPLAAVLLRGAHPLSYLPLFFFIGSVISGRNIGFETLALDIIPSERRTLYLGVRGSFNVMTVLLPVAGGFFIRSFGFTPVLYVVAFAMGLAVLFSFSKNDVAI